MAEVNKTADNKEPEKMDKKQAEGEIGVILGRIWTMGANDYEPSAIQNILDRLEKGEIEPNEAVEQARAIEASKQDYH